VKQYKDKDGKIIKVGDTLVDRKGAEWKLQNISGVTMLTQSDRNKIQKTVVWSKVAEGEWRIK